jgi:hypothetical protein
MMSASSWECQHMQSHLTSGLYESEILKMMGDALDTA